MIRRIGTAVAASLFVFAVACADTETDAGTEDNTILPAEDQTGGAGDMGTGTGTTAPGSDMGVADTSLTGSASGGAGTGGGTPGSTTGGTTRP